MDPDPVAVANALENRVLNGVEEGLEVRAGSLEAVAGERFDLVLANILARPLMDMAGSITAALAPGGALVLSGLLTEQAGGCGPGVCRAGPARAPAHGPGGVDRPGLGLMPVLAFLLQGPEGTGIVRGMGETVWSRGGAAR